MIKAIKAKTLISHIEKVLDWEIDILRRYQYVLSANSESQDITWLFEIANSRKELIVKILDNHCDKKFFKNQTDDTCEFSGNYIDDLYEIEKFHISNLENCAREYYCPQDLKEFIIENILPLSKKNISIFNEHKNKLAI